VDLLKILKDTAKNYRNKIPVLVTTDNALLFMDKHQSVLSKKFLFPWQKNRSLDQIVSKYTMMALAEECGLAVPLTFSSDKFSLNYISGKMKLPSIVKPLYSGGRGNGGRSRPVSSKKGIVVKSRTELGKIVSQRLFQDGYIVQEIIKGPETNLFAVGIYSDKNAEILACGCGRKIRQLPKDYGIATAIESADNEAVINLSKKFIKYLNYHGPAEIEFKISVDDGAFKFIEINPRHSGINQIFAEQGCDLAYINYLDLTGNQKLIVDGIKRNVRLISVVHDFLTIIQHHFSGPRKGSKILLEWFLGLLRFNGDTVFSFRDPLPFLALIIKVAKKAIKKRRDRRQIS
jgi:predicted ATP-grasp superfamily ATP-dependent carboligase